MHAFPTDGMEMNFPFARSVVMVRSRRTQKKDGATTPEDPGVHHESGADGADGSRMARTDPGTLVGVENRNHWRRDAFFGEDRSRSRQVGLLTNLALIRTALLRVIGRKFPGQSLPSLFDRLRTDPQAALHAIASW